jgi:FlgD Ig-like domain
MKKLIILTFFLALPGFSFGQVRVMYSHQSVGRYIISDPERAAPATRATDPIRQFLNPNVAFWDHDYYNFSTDLATPGTNVFGSILDPAGDIWPNILGFGAHRGSEPEEQLLDHLLGNAFLDTPEPNGRAFRDSILSRFDITLIMPGYLDVRMNTTSSLAAYQSMLNSVSDWWHTNNPGKFFVVMSASAMRHPSDYSGGTASWPNTPAGHAEAESDVAAYRELDLWMQNTWINRHPENRYFSVWWLVVNHSGSASEKYFTQDIFTGTGAGDDSGDHHLNIAGSDAVQAAMVQFINDLAAEFDGSTSDVGVPLNPGLTLHDPMPNPFNPTTVLAFDLAEVSEVVLSIHDLSGRTVRTLVNETRSSGNHQVSWDGRDHGGQRVSSGIYFYRIRAGEYSETKRMALVK